MVDRASKQASPAAHDKISVRALSGRHGVCETAREGPSKDSSAQLLRQSMLVTRITAAAYGTRLTFATRCLPFQLPAWSHRRRDSHSGLQSLASTSTRVSPRRHRKTRDSCPARWKKTLVALAEKNAAPGLHERGCQARSPFAWCRRLGGEAWKPVLAWARIDRVESPSYPGMRCRRRSRGD